MIRKAVRKDLISIIELTKACARKMIAQGIYQWNEHYPTRERFLQDIALQELYVLEETDRIKGIIVLTEKMDDVYIPIDWLTTTGRNGYIHRLAVDPEFWGMGYARQLMDWAETYAVAQGMTSMRLDTFSQNKRNQKFYETRGYQRLGAIFFPQKSEDPFHCYELVL